jgi:hypothetical protein
MRRQHVLHEDLSQYRRACSQSAIGGKGAVDVGKREKDVMRLSRPRLAPGEVPQTLPAPGAWGPAQTPALPIQARR